MNVHDGLNNDELVRLADIANCAVQYGSLGKIHGTAHLMGDALYDFDKKYSRNAHGSQEFGSIVDDLYAGWRERRDAERNEGPES